MHAMLHARCGTVKRESPTFHQEFVRLPWPAARADAGLHISRNEVCMPYRPENADMHAGAGKPPRLLDEVRRVLRVKHYSLRTEHVYVGWIRRFILANGKRHPRDMGPAEVEQFLSQLAVRGNVAASTQNQALSALLFLYRQVLQVELPWLDGVERAKKPQRLPVVLTPLEARALLDLLVGVHWLMGSLLYGTGMRLMECVRLRVKDVDFARGEILVRQ